MDSLVLRAEGVLEVADIGIEGAAAADDEEAEDDDEDDDEDGMTLKFGFSLLVLRVLAGPGFGCGAKTSLNTNVQSL